MSHTESTAVVVTTNGGGAPHHKKLRKKRKELDALVSEEKIRRKSSSGSHQDLLYSDSDDIEFGGKGSMQPFFSNGGLFGILPGAFTLLMLIVTVVGLGATLKLLMTTRKDLDMLHVRFNAVEASGSELPAKFHESHVRLQMVEKNHSAIWNTLNEITEDMIKVKIKLSTMETSLNTLEKSFLRNPSLKSLPNNVAELQNSITAFGASLQDVHTSFKVTTEEHEKVKHSLEANDKAIVYIQNELISLHNASFLQPSISSDGVTSEQPVALAVHHIIRDLYLLNATVNAINSSVSSKLDVSSTKNNKVFEMQLASLTKRFEEIDKTLGTLPTQNLTNIPDQVKNLKEIFGKFGKNLENLTNSIDVVKGVEKKLEGSQVQMASGVSALKQQVQKIEGKLNSLIAPTSTPTSLTPVKYKRNVQRMPGLT